MNLKFNIGIVKEFSWVLIGNIVNTLGLLAVTKILSFYLSQTSFGLYYLGTTLSIFAIQIFFGPFGNGFSRFYWVADEKKDLSSYFSQSLILVRFITLIFISFSIILYFYINKKYDIGLQFFLFFLILAISTSFSALVFSYFNILRLRRLVAFYQIIETALKVLSLIFVAYYLENTIFNFLYILNAISIIILFFQIFHLNKFGVFKNKLNWSLNGNWTYSLFSFSYPFAIWGVFTWFQMSSDRYFLGSFLSPIKVAEYAILFQLGYYPPSILISNFVQTITPILYQKAGASLTSEDLQNSSSIIINMTLYSCVLVAIGFVFTFMVSDVIIKLLAHEQYLKASYLLPYMFLAGGVFSTAQILSIDFQSKLRMKELMLIKIITSLIGIITSFFCIKFYGLKGAVFSSIWFSISYLLTLWFFKRKTF